MAGLVPAMTEQELLFSPPKIGQILPVAVLPRVEEAMGAKPHSTSYLPQTWEPEVQTKGTVMPVQQVV
jgi:hypothetical protein